MCLGAEGVVVALGREGFVLAEFDDGDVREVSTAVLIADGMQPAPGDHVYVSMGMALRLSDGVDRTASWT